MVEFSDNAVHGGPDAWGVPLHDFSTNSNACGPCTAAWQAVQQADAALYPDPAYTVLRAQLGALHGVAAERIVVAGSASEFIHRITVQAARSGVRTAVLPAHSYGDYERAAQVWGLQVLRPGVPHVPASPSLPTLHWVCEPSSPLGQNDPAVTAWSYADHGDNSLCVIDCAYRSLRLEEGAWPALPDNAWQLWTPNKALGMTGVRAAYAIAPAAVSAAMRVQLQALAPSWPVGAHGVAMLAAWATAPVQQWVAGSAQTLRLWKAALLQVCQALGWTVLPGSMANYFVAQVPVADLPARLQQLRQQHGIKLRDCASFGLPGHVRLGVLAPVAQQALLRAWKSGHGQA
jgi:histidinol-phosphate aminotransferase